MIVPWILPDRKLKLELAKLFCIIAITIRPGARKLSNGTPRISRPPRPSATEKITRNSSVVKAGAHTVCVCTLKKRRTSLRYRLHRPIVLIPWIFGSPHPGKLSGAARAAARLCCAGGA